LRESASAVDKGELKPLVLRAYGRAVAQVPLADGGCSIVRGSEGLRECDLVRPEHRPARVGIDDATSVVVSTREQTSACGSADGLRIKPGESGAFETDPVDVRSAERGIPLNREISIPLIIGDDEEDVRSACPTRSRRGFIRRESRREHEPQ
jgi:hypothetical protein